jgi:hypothetical protein
MIVALEWKEVAVWSRAETQVSYAGRPGTMNPADYELANSVMEMVRGRRMKSEGQSDNKKEEERERGNSVKAYRVYMTEVKTEEEEAFVELTYAMQVRDGGAWQTLITSQIARSPAENHTMVIGHVPMMEQQTMKEGEGVVLAGATNMTVSRPQEMFDWDAKEWVKCTKGKEWICPNEQELMEMIKGGKVAPRDYEDQTLRILEDGSYRMGLCHHGNGKIWQTVDTQEKMVDIPQKATEMRAHYVAVTLEVTPAEAKRGDMQVEIIMEEGSKAKGLIRRDMQEKDVMKLRKNLAVKPVAARIHHNEGLGLKFEGVVFNYVCVAVVSEAQARKVLQQMRKKQRGGASEILMDILRNEKQERSQERKAQEVGKNQGEEKETKEEAFKEDEDRRMLEMRGLQERWEDMTVQDVHQALERLVGKVEEEQEEEEEDRE